LSMTLAAFDGHISRCCAAPMARLLDMETGLTNQPTVGIDGGFAIAFWAMHHEMGSEVG